MRASVGVGQRCWPRTCVAMSAPALFSTAACVVAVLRLWRSTRRKIYGDDEVASEYFCRVLPKVELHAHINGSIRASTLREFVMASVPELDDKIPNGEASVTRAHRQKMLDSLTLRSDDQRSLKECFAIFDVIHSVVVNTDMITRITREVVEDFAADGCVYLELRSTPRRDVMTAREYVAAVEEGLAQGEAKANSSGRRKIHARLLLSINRSQSASIAEDTVGLALELAARDSNVYIVGVELSGNPFSSSFDVFEPALRKAREGGLKVSVHAAEVDNERETTDMLAFKPDRLGHALFLEPQHIRNVLDSGIPIEICPTSNRLTLQLLALHEHPNLSTWIEKLVLDVGSNSDFND